MNFVTIAIFSNIVDLHIIMGKIENEGIECFVKDEHTIAANPFYDIAVGGIKLQVREEDEIAAREILKETSYNDSASLSGVTAHGTRTASRMFKILFLILSLLLMAFYYMSKIASEY